MEKHVDCRFTFERLVSAGLKANDNCPFCSNRDVQCSIFEHPEDSHPQQVAVSPPSPVVPQIFWYLSESTIMSLHKYELRGSVYDLAGLKGGFHVNQEKTSISYDDHQVLAVRVLFPQISQCGIFQSSLECMVKRHFDQDAEVVHTRVYTPVIKPTNPMAILSSDYISGVNPHSEYSEDSRLSSPDDLIVEPDIHQPILWENVNLSRFGGGCKGKRCHLMSQSPFFQHADNVNNILFMSAENRARFE